MKHLLIILISILLLSSFLVSCEKKEQVNLTFPNDRYNMFDSVPFSKTHLVKWTPSQGQFFSGVKVYFSLFFIVLFMLPSWQLLFPNKSQQVFFLPEIDLVSQNCKTQNNPLTLRVISEQFQTPPGISFRTLLTSISIL